MFDLIDFKFSSSPVLNRCVPKVAEALISNFYGLLNSWDVIEQILGDLYSTWKEIFGLAVLSLSEKMFLA